MKRLFYLFLLTVVTSLTSTAQVSRVLTLADSLVGGVGGIAVDRIGNIYSADFMDTVWRIKPDGRVSKFATGLYGPSGNYFDRRGNLLQSNFYGNSISIIDRSGHHKPWVEEGLNGPVGITIAPDGGVFVVNCIGNYVSRISDDHIAKTYSESSLFNCPNGITTGPDSLLYVVNFSDGNVLRLAPDGTPRVLATIPGPGNGHIATAQGALYVTAFQSNKIYRVSVDGDVDLVAGTGAFAEVDGKGLDAAFVFPNGIAVHPSANDRLYVNDYINRTLPGVDVPPVPLANVRLLRLASVTDVMEEGLSRDGVKGLENAFRKFVSARGSLSPFAERSINVFGYTLMNQSQMEAAEKVFELNVETYPNSFNVYDSLAEAYLNQGKKALAIEFYNKSLKRNPENQNAKDKLAELGTL